MARYSGYSLPEDCIHEDQLELYRRIIDTLGDFSTSLAVLESDPQRTASEVYTSLTQLQEKNPTSSKLKDLHSFYVSRLRQLPEQELSCFFSQLRTSLTSEQVICWAKYPDTYHAYLLPSQHPNMEDIKFQEDLMRVNSKKDAFDLFSSSTLSLKRLWRCIYILSIPNQHCAKIRDLKYYFIQHVKGSKRDCEKLRHRIHHLMSKNDSEIWDKLIPPALIPPSPPVLSSSPPVSSSSPPLSSSSPPVSSSPPASPLASLVPIKTKKKRLIKISISNQLALSISFYALVRFLGDGALNDGLGVAITFGTLFIFVVLVNTLAARLSR